ncbi:MAG: flagellar hook-basal body complex protein [Lachnospiraceae bacterium]|nr:flagellar hook-basal body complex protein [Lachnospiraceae bacterium]
MMRSLYSGVSGLKTHQTKMDVIGNNIANVNTTAFKSSSITFSELMSQTTAAASGPNAATGTGGTNAKQIGLGVKSGAISVAITTQGSAQSTGNPFDIMITGDNFFVVNNGSSNFFTRDGSFYVDGAGNLAMTSTGYNVMGWQVDETTGEIKQESVSALRIMSAANMTYPPEATTKAYLSGILDQNDTDVTSDAGKSINLNFYDALGYSYTARLTVKESDNAGVYSVELTKLLDSEGNSIDISGIEAFGSNTTLSKGTIVLDGSYQWDGNTLKDADGNVVATVPIAPDAEGNYTEEQQTQLDAIAKAYGYAGSTAEFLSLGIDSDADGALTASDSYIADLLAAGNLNSVSGAAADGAEINVDGRKIDGINLNFNTATGAFSGLNGTTSTSAIINFSALGGEFEDIVVDFAEMSMYNNNGTSTVTATSGDKNGIGSGRMLGDMIGVTVQNNGMIYASYDNGMTKLLGQIATASFSNASGLAKEGDNLYSATMNSGEFDGIGIDVTANGGYMSTGVLEMSNVDLSTEFTNMITTQRGFQANSRIITVSDTLLEELTNLKR